MDDNLDDSDKKGEIPSYQQNLQKLFDLRQRTINNRNLILLQTDNTFHRNNIQSRINHIVIIEDTLSMFKEFISSQTVRKNFYPPDNNLETTTSASLTELDIVSSLGLSL